MYLKPVGFSLETPTVKCDLLSKREEFGGAANVAISLSRLGCEVDFLTSISNESMKNLKNAYNVNVIQLDSKNQIKERYYLTKSETYKYLQVNDCRAIENANCPHVDFFKYDVIVVSDYRLGVLSENVISSLPKEKTICQMQISDSKDDLKKYEGFHCIVGNEDEIPIVSIKEFFNSHRLNACVSTQGKEGAIYFDGETMGKVPAPNLPRLKDYHGAGDAFFAGFVAAYDFDIKSLKHAVQSGTDFSASFLTRKDNIHEA